MRRTRAMSSTSPSDTIMRSISATLAAANRRISDRDPPSREADALAVRHADSNAVARTKAERLKSSRRAASSHILSVLAEG